MNFTALQNITIPGPMSGAEEVARWCGYYDSRAAREAVLASNQLFFVYFFYGLVLGALLMYGVLIGYNWYRSNKNG